MNIKINKDTELIIKKDGCLLIYKSFFSGFNKIRFEEDDFSDKKQLLTFYINNNATGYLSVFLRKDVLNQIMKYFKINKDGLLELKKVN